MSETTPPTADQESPPPKWQPLGRIERRVLGVLVEKAKTTPEAYPLTLNALTNGCNQKNNRDPQMNLEPDAVEEALENLRTLSAVVEVVGSEVCVLTGRAIPATQLDQAVLEEQLATARAQPANTPELMSARDRAIDLTRGQLRVARRAK